MSVQPKATAQPKVSVIIPTFNALKYLPGTIDSVLRGSEQDFEIIVVDDCSTDGTDIHFDSALLDARIKYIRLEKNWGGPAEPRNVGVSAARGEYIAFLDADDLWHSEKLAVQLKFINTNKLSFVSSIKINFKNEDAENIKKKLSEKCKGEPTAKTINFKKLLQKNLIFTSSVLIKSSLIKNRKFRNDQDYIAVEDFDLWLRILRDHQTHCAIINLVLVYYRENSQGISKAKWRMARKVWKMLGSEEYALPLTSRMSNFISYAVKSVIRSYT